ncbi:MAG: DEAD/DEAH box helicase, partial [Microcystaceae cyanobacterium]
MSQTHEKFQQFGLECGFIKAGWEENREALVQIASVQTLASRDWWQQHSFDLVLLDECHLTSFSSVVKQMMTQVHPGSIYLGLTATPWRLSRLEGMGDLFKSLVCAPMPYELIDQGFLIKPSYYSADLTDLSQVKTIEGEFDEVELALATDKPEIIKQIVSEWTRLAYGRRTIAFAVNVKHSQHLCEAFQAEGIPAAHVDGTTPIKVRHQIYQQLAEGEIWVLSSCNAVTEGFDVPSVNAILLCRGTQSRALNVQMVGRGLRTSLETDKSDCIVLDFVGNIERHGFIEDIKEIQLSQGREPGAGIPPKKVCPTEDGGCGAVLYGFQMRCPECNYHFESRKLDLFVGLKQQLREEDLERLEFYRDKLKEAYDKRYAPTWAANVFREKFGHWPPWDWAKKAVFGESPTQEDKAA